MIALAEPVHLPAGAYCSHAGVPFSAVAFVLRGRLRVFRTSSTGRQITLYYVEACQTCTANLICAFLDSTAPASAVADLPTDAVLIPADRFRCWARDCETLRNHLFNSMSERLTHLITLVDELSFRRVDDRVADFLVNAAEHAAGAAPTLKLTHEEIAARLGSAREVVSRILKDFERCGAVELHRGHIIVRDVAALRLATPDKP